MTSLRIRVGAICCEHDSVLLVEHEKDGRRYWLLPGGGMRVGETAPDALAREVLEETSVTVEPQGLVAVCESISPDRKRHIVHFLYAANRTAGTPGISRDPRVRRSAFVSLSDLKTVTLYPPIPSWLAEQLPQRARSGPVYLGAMWI